MRRNITSVRLPRCRLRTLLLLIALFCGICNLAASGALTNYLAPDAYHRSYTEWSYGRKVVDGLVVFQPAVRHEQRLDWPSLVSNGSLGLALLIGTGWLFLWDRYTAT